MQDSPGPARHAPALRQELEILACVLPRNRLPRRHILRRSPRAGRLLAIGGGGRSEGSGGSGAMPVEIAEARGVAQEDQLDLLRLVFAVLGDDELGQPLVLLARVVDLVAIDESDEVGVLLDASALAQVR